MSATATMVQFGFSRNRNCSVTSHAARAAEAASSRAASRCRQHELVKVMPVHVHADQISGRQEGRHERGSDRLRDAASDQKKQAKRHPIESGRERESGRVLCELARLVTHTPRSTGHIDRPDPPAQARGMLLQRTHEAYGGEDEDA